VNTDSQVFLPAERYRFLGKDVVVRSNSVAMLSHLRLMFGRFYAGEADGCMGPHASVEIMDHLASDSAMTMQDDQYLYHLSEVGAEWQFSRQHRETLEFDVIGMCGPQTLLQSGLISTVAGAARDYTLLHAGAVAFDGRAIILPAAPSMGKTSLVLKLVQAGCKFLSDEIACLDPQSGTVEPFPRKLLCRREAERLLDIKLPATTTTVASEAHEWEAAFDIEALFPQSLSGPCALEWVIFLRGFGDEPRLERISNARALFDLFRFWVENGAALPEKLMTHAALVDRLRCYTLVIGTPDETVKVVMDMLRNPGSDGVR
jgi:hypothetical protein